MAQDPPEPRRGEPQYEPTDREFASWSGQGIAKKGHPLQWATEAGAPRWLPHPQPPGVCDGQTYCSAYLGYLPLVIVSA